MHGKNCRVDGADKRRVGLSDASRQLDVRTTFGDGKDDGEDFGVDSGFAIRPEADALVGLDLGLEPDLVDGFDKGVRGDFEDDFLEARLGVCFEIDLDVGLWDVLAKR